MHRVMEPLAPRKSPLAGLRLPAAVLLALSAALTGCRQDMHNQPKFYPQRGTTFYADGRSVRPQLPNTVARQQGDSQSYFLTGMVPDPHGPAGATIEGDGMPVPVTPELLARGQERYNIYCTPCHSRTGYGHGMIVQRGYEPAAPFHSTRLREAPLGHFFAVITNGLGAMPDYKAQVTPADRWAIAAFLRALQLSQNAKATDAPATAKVRSLDEIASSQGLPPDFANTRYWTSSVARLPSYAAGGVGSLTSTPVPGVPSAPAAPTPQASGNPASGSPASGNLASGPLASGSLDKKTPGTDATPKPAAPKPPTAKGNAAAGKEVYLTNCAICHQDTLAGRPPKIPALLNIIQRTNEDHVRTTIYEGKPDARPMMPSFADKLSPQQVDDLIAFLKTGKPANE